MMGVLAPLAAKELAATLLVFDKFAEVESKARQGNVMAQQVLFSWADAQWFTSRPAVAEKITLTVMKVTGETNTDDLSPAPEAWSRPDIPLHALTMLSVPREGITPDLPGIIGPVSQLAALSQAGHPLAYVGDVVGTGSSRKSATNSILWYIGQDIPFVPGKRCGGIVLAGKIAPIFFNTLEDSGALPIEVDVTSLAMGEVGLRLTFRDEGPGIPDLKLAMTDGWTSGSGMGLGLTGAKRLVEEFELETEPGKGTRITITRWT